MVLLDFNQRLAWFARQSLAHAGNFFTELIHSHLDLREASAVLQSLASPLVQPGKNNHTKIKILNLSNLLLLIIQFISCHGIVFMKFQKD